ncbi:MAG: DUF3082 domain-containing protein [Cyanobacteria bacterium J06631_12]
MENAKSSSNSTKSESTLAAGTESTPSPTPLRCFTGAFGAATLSLLAYRLTLSVATTFADKPVVSDNPTVVNVSAAVRTLVIGIVALGAGVFGVAALGLGALGIQLLVKRMGERRTQ